MFVCRCCTAVAFGMLLGVTQACQSTSTASECTADEQCPGTDTECQHRLCLDSKCYLVVASSGSLAPTQTAGDCQRNVCDGTGAVVSATDDSDVPDDSNECTIDTCTAGVPTNTAAVAGTTCSIGVCDSAGTCGCLDASTCPGSDDECGQRTCNDRVCGMSYAAAGTVLATQVSGDCVRWVCDGVGNSEASADDSDIPDDGNECTLDTCSTGAVANSPVADGTTCAGGTCNGGYCAGTIGTFAVVRVGDGTKALSDAAAPVFVETRDLAGALVSTVALPIEQNGVNAPFSLPGTAGQALSATGSLTRSANGSYLVVAGFAAQPDTAAVASTSNSVISRVIARIDGAGTVDTSTLLDSAFDKGSPRSVATTDGLSFFASGDGVNATSGIYDVTLGSTVDLRVISADVRVAAIFAGRLFVSSELGNSISTIDGGLPVTATTLTPLSLDNTTAGGNSPWAFAFFDRDASVAGLDTLYIADDRTPDAGGGVQKWTFDGITWTLVATYNSGLASVGLRGLAGLSTGSQIVLIATTAEVPPQLNQIIKYVDDGTDESPTAEILATAANSTAFRGAAF